jgi:hypothetical protein
MPDPATPDESRYATREQIVRIASRLFAAYLLFWVATDLIQLPREIMTVIHYQKETFAMGGSIKSSYALRVEMLYLLDNTLQIALWLLGAGWFYRCGPKIHAFFNPRYRGQASSESRRRIDSPPHVTP